MKRHEDETLSVTARDTHIGEPDFRPLDEDLRLCEFDWGRVLPAVVPVYWIKDVPICTPGNLVAITASPKLGKSALGAAMIASTMVEGSGADTLHVKSANVSERAVIHFDTEQDVMRHDDLVRRIVRQANRNRPPSWFHSYHVKGVAPDVLKARLERALAVNSQKHGGVHSVLLDGVADFVEDPNSPDECFPFITWLESMAVRYNSVVVCVLHLNPGSSFGSGVKSRGHLGSQLERKAETEVRLKKDSDGAVSYWTHLARGKPITQENALRFQWNDELGRHICVPGKKEARETKELQRLEKLYAEAQAILRTDEELSFTETVNRIASRHKISKKAAQQRHAVLCAKGLLVQGSNRGWRLVQ